MFSKRIHIQLKLIVVVLVAILADHAMDKYYDWQDVREAKMQKPVFNSDLAWLK